MAYPKDNSESVLAHQNLDAIPAFVIKSEPSLSPPSNSQGHFVPDTTHGVAHGTTQGADYGMAQGMAHDMTHGVDYGTTQGVAYGTNQGVAHGTTQGTGYGMAQGMEYGTTQGVAYGMAQGMAHNMTQGVDFGTTQGTGNGVAQGMEYGTTQGMAHDMAQGMAHDMTQGVDFGTTQGVDFGTTQGVDFGATQGVDFGTTQGSGNGVAQGMEYGTNQGMAHDMAQGMAHDMTQGMDYGTAQGVPYGMLRGAIHHIIHDLLSGEGTNGISLINHLSNFLANFLANRLQVPEELLRCEQDVATYAASNSDLKEPGVSFAQQIVSGNFIPRGFSLGPAATHDPDWTRGFPSFLEELIQRRINNDPYSTILKDLQKKGQFKQCYHCLNRRYQGAIKKFPDYQRIKDIVDRMSTSIFDFMISPIVMEVGKSWTAEVLEKVSNVLQNELEVFSGMVARVLWEEHQREART